MRRGFRFLGALPDVRSATLDSLNAITTYGYESFSLAPHWQMMGTRVLFVMIPEVWQSHRRQRYR